MGGNDVGLDSGGGSRGASFGGLGMRAIFSLSVWCTIRLNRSLGQEMASLLRVAVEIDNFAMATSLVASTRGVALLPASINDVLPPSVVSRPLGGEQPTVDLMVGYRRDNDSPILRVFLSRLGELLRPGAP
jgi:DNA-binding transcriptional LysR family regulator